MGYAVEQQSIEENELPQKKTKWYRNWNVLTPIGILMILIIVSFAWLTYYQANHFNANVTINDVTVSGLTTDQALSKLQEAVLTNDIYIGSELIIDGEETQMSFTETDLPEIEKLLNDQWTFFPSKEERKYQLTPSEQNLYRSETLRGELEGKLISMNMDLQAPVDAQVYIEEGEIVISDSIDGEQYDVVSILSEYDSHQGYTHDIHLTPSYLQPVREDSDFVKNLEVKLQEFLDHTVEYTVQDKIIPIKASEVIKDASLSEDLEVIIESEIISQKIAEVNEEHSTLGKDFTFTTHSGSVISVKGQGYGWALDVELESALVLEAFEKGETSITASNTYGNGWSGEGYGYDITANNGIGETYAEVSIADQRIWLYRDGELVLTTNVVTGKRSTGEDTSPGVWYILYKRTPYTLTGSAVGNPNYSADVDYWAPFTNSGQGFHDASWRTNWGSNAYLTAGSAGCVNVPPSVMKSVYENLTVYQPVVIY